MTDRANPAAPADERLAVAVVRLAEDGPSQVRGDLVALDSDEATLRLPDGGSFEEGELVVLVRGKAGSRQVARAAWVRAENGYDVFSLNARFEPFDVRRDRRIPTHLAVEVWQGDTCLPGTMLDISNGGAAVATRERPDEQPLLLAISIGGFSARLACKVVGVGGTIRQPVAHLQFERLNVAEQAFVRGVMRAAEASPPERTGNAA